MGQTGRMESCDECEFEYSSVSEAEIGDRVRLYGQAIADRLVLGHGDEWHEALRTRSAEGVWSPFEYACHTLDVMRVQRRRLTLALTEHCPDWTPSGIHDPANIATFLARDTASVIGDLSQAVTEIAAAFDALSSDQWQRTGIYHWPTTAERTMAWFGRHSVHELRHHLGDIDAGIAAGPRPWPARALSEVPSLLSWLEFHRATLAGKVEGLDNESLRRRMVESSTLTLLGLVRHMAEVEFFWFRVCWTDTDADLFATTESPDADFDDVATADIGEALATWRAECANARRVVADTPSLDTLAKRLRHGQPVSMRWILTHMIEEYARHNGHADLLRELTDGTTGD